MLLALGDAVALTLFAVIGLFSHGEGLAPAGLARNALPILGGWFGAAALLWLYSRGGVLRFVLTWSIGVTAGVILRGVILGRSLGGAEVTFWAVTMAVTLALVAAWRLVAWRLLARPLSSWPGTSLRRSG
jgi:hypothetical protein